MGVAYICPNCKKQVNSDEHVSSSGVICPDCGVKFDAPHGGGVGTPVGVMRGMAGFGVGQQSSAPKTTAVETVTRTAPTGQVVSTSKPPVAPTPPVTPVKVAADQKAADDAAKQLAEDKK